MHFFSYYSTTAGERRIKRRYRYAFAGWVLGFGSGIVLMAVL